MEAQIQLINIGTGHELFDIYTNYDNFTNKLNLDPIPLVDLLSGDFIIEIPTGSTIIRLQSIWPCSGYVDQELTSNGPDAKFLFSMSPSKLSLTIPLHNGYDYDMTIDWGDGSAKSVVKSYNDINARHTYNLPGEYVVSISGKCGGFYFYSSPNRGNLIKILDN